MQHSIFTLVPLMYESMIFYSDILDLIHLDQTCLEGVNSRSYEVRPAKTILPD